MRFRKLKKQSKQKIQKNQNKSVILPFAKMTDKIKAFITDMFMIYMPILYVITYVVLGGKDEFQESSFAPFIGVVLYAVIYSILLTKFAQTPGKKAYSIKVVDNKTFENISFFRALFRYFIFLVSATILIGLVFPFFRKDRKFIHDIVCNTVEIEVEK